MKSPEMGFNPEPELKAGGAPEQLMATKEVLEKATAQSKPEVPTAEEWTEKPARGEMTEAAIGSEIKKQEELNELKENPAEKLSPKLSDLYLNVKKWREMAAASPAAEKEYATVQKEFMKAFLEKSKEKFKETQPEKWEKISKQLVFEKFAIKEEERFSKEKQEALPAEDKGRFKTLLSKAGQKWSKIPAPARWAISAAAGTAVAFGFGGVAAPALLGAVGFRYGRAALGSLSAVGVKGLGDGLEKIWAKKWGREVREEKVKKSLVEQAEQVKNVEELTNLIMQKREERNKELARVAKQQKYWRIGKMAAMIGAGAGVAYWAGHPESFTGNADIIDKIKTFAGFKKAVVAGALETAPKPAVGIPEVAPEKIISGVEVAEKGDSIWKMAARQLHNRFGEKFDQLDAARKTYLIDAIKDEVAADPEQFGLKNVDILQVDQQVNFSSIFEDKANIEQVFANAKNLSPDQFINILRNNKAILEWTKAHPNAFLSSEQVEQILNPGKFKIPTEVLQEPMVAVPKEIETEVLLPAWKPGVETVPEPGTPEFYDEQTLLENQEIPPEDRLNNINEALSEVNQKINDSEALTNSDVLSPETKGYLARDIDTLKQHRGLLEKSIATEAYSQPLSIRETLPPKVMDVAEFKTMSLAKSFTELVPLEKTQVNNLFFKYTGHSFENFNSVPVERQVQYMDGINEAMKILKSGAETTVNVAEKTFKMRNLGELKWLQELWIKFGQGATWEMKLAK